MEACSTKLQIVLQAAEYFVMDLQQTENKEIIEYYYYANLMEIWNNNNVCWYTERNVVSVVSACHARSINKTRVSGSDKENESRISVIS